MSANGLQFLRDNWVILAFMVGIIVSWTQFQGRVAALEVDVARHDSTIDQNSSTVNTLIADIREIKVSLEFIKDQLAD